MKSHAPGRVLLVAVALSLLPGLAGCSGIQCLGDIAIDCDGTCTATWLDANNCGYCGSVCGAGAPVCDLGKCQPCPAGTLVCTIPPGFHPLKPDRQIGRTCADPTRDGDFCGASGNCTGPNVGVQCFGTNMGCVNGECVCPSPLTVCAGECIDTTLDGRFCGASGDCTGPNAGVNCGSAAICVDGVCEPCIFTCTGSCVDPLRNLMWCGASGDCQGTSAGKPCPIGQTCVKGVCM